MDRPRGVDQEDRRALRLTLAPMRKFKHKYMSDFAREHYAKGYEEGFA